MYVFKLFLLLALAGLLSACSPTRVARSLPMDAQCRIMTKKRIAVARPRHNPKIAAGRHTLYISYGVEAAGHTRVTVMRPGDPGPMGEHTPGLEALPGKAGTMQWGVSPSDQSTNRREVERGGRPRDDRPVPVAQSIVPKSTKYREDVYFNEDRRFTSLFVASALACIGLLAFGQARWKRLSQWAAANPWKARGLIAGIHAMTAVGALAAGNDLWAAGSVVSDQTMFVALSAFTLGTVLYPGRDFSLMKRTYLGRKIHDVVLFTSGVALMIYAGNHYEITGSVPPAAGQVYATHAKWTQYRVIDRAPAQTAFQADPAKKRTGVKILLTVLAVAGFVGLTMLLAALACNISCAGYDALALIVFFGGEVGLVLLLVTAIRAIFGRKKRRHSQPAGG